MNLNRKNSFIMLYFICRDLPLMTNLIGNRKNISLSLSLSLSLRDTWGVQSIPNSGRMGTVFTAGRSLHHYVSRVASDSVVQCYNGMIRDS